MTTIATLIIVNAMGVTFGKRLLQQRHARGLTQGQFAALLGVHHVTVCRWERGRQGLSPDKAQRLAKKLGVSPTWLLFGTAVA